ncbi:fimbrial protein [Pseudomonas sp. JV241A]|uniref:fimbrial protein n=1 Tax=Pseudomonas sp. JV241A TaxID=2078785 RepID=UPI000F9F0B53|nr:fimbrial protein [Pseudomonas sp. JV241A]SPO68086.1 Fimbrial protein [Pseudomonas sp. JV241A]
MSRSTALLLPLALCTLSVPFCFAEPVVTTALKGRVQMTGSIVDSACTIRVGNDSQTIAFKPTALNGLVNGDTSSKQPLNIYINDCIEYRTNDDTEPSQRFKLTFEGASEGKYFSIQGAAQGIALQIKDSQGQLISPGMLLQLNSASADMLTLNYSLSLVGSGHALEAGDYHATIKLSIQHF